MAITLDLTDRGDFKGFSNRIGGVTVEELSKEIPVIGRKAATLVKRNFSGNKSGRLYRRRSNGRRYRASAVGEAPAVNTGSLRRGIKGNRISKLRYAVNSTAPHTHLLLGAGRVIFDDVAEANADNLVSQLIDRLENKWARA